MADIIIFCGHDPGSINHMRPIVDRMQHSCTEGDENGAGYDCQLVHLRPSSDSGKAWPEAGSVAAVKHCHELLLSIVGGLSGSLKRIKACIMGISTNKAELDMARACREHGIPTCILIDFMAGHRLEDREPKAYFPDLFLVTNNDAADDIAKRYGVDPNIIKCVGSTYLESLVIDLSPSAVSVEDTFKILGVGRSITADVKNTEVLIPFFVSPDDMVPDALEAIPNCIKMFCRDVCQVLENTRARVGLAPTVVVCMRLHPRNSPGVKAALQALVAEWAGMSSKQAVEDGSLPVSDSSDLRLLLDLDSGIDNKSLCRASLRTVSMGSTLGVESAAWGAPAAFYQRGWDSSRIETIMGALPVMRIRDVAKLDAFLGFQQADDLQKGDGDNKFNVENCNGAIDNAWACITNML